MTSLLGILDSSRRLRCGLAVLGVAAITAACGGSDDAGRAGRPTTSATGSAPAGEPEQILIKTRVDLPTGRILAGSTIGNLPFCAGGTVSDNHGTPEVGLVARTVTCTDGTLRMGFDPLMPVGDTQRGEWRIISGTGAYEGWHGTGEMMVRYDPGSEEHPTKGRESFTGTVRH